MSFSTIPRPHRVHADGLPHIGPCMVMSPLGDFPGSHAGELACDSGERLDPDETTVRFESDVRPRPRLSYWVARQRFLLRGQGGMLLLGVILGCLFFALLRASLGLSVAAPAAAMVAPKSSEASPPHTTEHFRSAELALLPQLLAAVSRTPVAVAERRSSSRAEARTERASSRKQRRAALVSCDPPYRYDAAGIKRIKRACL